MHRIDTSGSVAGEFSEGNPSTGTPATVLGAAWLNDLQANVLEVLEEGGIDPTKGRARDLVEAIMAIASGAAGSGGGSVPTTRMIATSGLATGGGSLAADRTITVAAASAAEVLAGVLATKVVTPASLMAAFSSGLGAGTFQIGPLILKWGSRLEPMTESTLFSAFSQPFPTACFVVLPVVRNDSGNQLRDTWIQNVGAPSADGFTVRVQSSGSNSTGDCDGFDWFAIGY
jgi:hypothetical protein